MTIYAMRPLLALDLLFFFVLVPISVIGWSAVVLRRLWLRQWSAALFSSAFLAFAALAIIAPTTIGRPMIGLVQKVEFLTMRSVYNAKVATIPNAGTPRLIKVANRDTSLWCCSTQTFEEVWFDESDALGNPDRTVTDRVLGHPSYSIHSLGDHYYFVDSWY